MNGQSVILIVIFMVMIMHSRGQVSRVPLHPPPPLIISTPFLYPDPDHHHNDDDKQALWLSLLSPLPPSTLTTLGSLLPSAR